MQNPENREEKLQGGEIRIPRSARKDREHGRVYKWFDNFWYHHKWKTIFCVSLALVILVCSLQMCGKEASSDATIVFAGPYAFTEEAKMTNLTSCLSLYMPEEMDENGDGRRAELIVYTVYSAEQIAALRERVDEEGNADPFEVNTVTNSQEYSAYNEYMMTGETSILLLDPWLFEQMAGKGNEFLVDLESSFGKTPQGAIYHTDKDGTQRCVGVRLGDTELYRSNSAVRVLPEDTVLCLLGPYFIGKSSDEAVYHQTVHYFAALAGIQ